MGSVALLVIALIWIAITAFLLFFLGRTPKGRAWTRLLWHSRKIRWVAAAFTCALALIVATYASLSRVAEDPALDFRQVFGEFSGTMVENLGRDGSIRIDSSCNLAQPLPELAYSLPTLLKIYNGEVSRPTVPRLLRLDDTLWISFEGYKQFKNRGIRIVRTVQRKLGSRYSVKISSRGDKHRLELVYRGAPWNAEQLCGLPVMDAALRANVDPALLMALVRHTSKFDMEYRGPRGKGLLALDSVEGLGQLYVGAELLAAFLRQEKTVEDAVAQMNPMRERGTFHEEWRNNPLKQSWIDEVLKDVPYYRENGLVLDSVEKR